MPVTQDPRFGTNRWGAGTDPWPARPGWNALLDLLTTKAAIFAEGTFAARPAFSAAKKGTFYWATDQQRLYYQSATAWTEVSPTGGGGGGVASQGRTGVEGTSRLAARSDHSHPDPNYGTRPLINGSDDPIGTFSTTRPTKTYAGFTSQATDGHGFFQISSPETATGLIGAVATPYYTSGGSLTWYPVLRGDHTNTATITFQARRVVDGGELANTSIRCTFALWYQVNG